MSVIEMISHVPLFGVAITVGAYVASKAAHAQLGHPAWAHPLLLATTMLAGLLWLTEIPYATYFSQAGVLNNALALIIVLLAVPLVRQSGLLIASCIPLVIALIVGSMVAIMTALALPLMLGAPDAMLATLAPKSATAAVAVEVAVGLGGYASATAVIVITTGIFGAAFGPAILKLAGVDDDRAVGFALGVASHAIGTARAFQISDVAGAFASLGMTLNAVLTIVLVPAILTIVL